jgi:hypothetical protein
LPKFRYVAFSFGYHLKIGKDCLIFFFKYKTLIMYLLSATLWLNFLPSLTVVASFADISILHNCDSQRRELRMLTPVEPGAELLAALAADQLTGSRPALADQLTGAVRSRPGLLLTPAKRDLMLALVQQLANSDRLVRQQASR